MKNTITLDHINYNIVMDRTFAKLAANARSEEYTKLQNVRRDYPDYKVITRTIKRNPEKETYKGLTYAYMTYYIMNHEPIETRNAVLAEFNEMHVISKCHAVGKRYPTIKKWFLEKYPGIVRFGVDGRKTDNSAEINRKESRCIGGDVA